MLLSNSNPAIYFVIVFMKRKKESARNVLFVAAQTGSEVKISCLSAETRGWGDVAVLLPSYAVESVRLRRQYRRVWRQRRKRRRRWRRQPQKANRRFRPKRLRRELKSRRTIQRKCHQWRSTTLKSPGIIMKTIPMQSKKKRVSFWYVSFGSKILN